MFEEHLAKLARSDLDLSLIRKVLAEFSQELEIPLSGTFEARLKRISG